MNENSLVIIDSNGFWRGFIEDTPEVRVRLQEEGFEVSDGCATKQYSKGGEKS